MGYVEAKKDPAVIERMRLLFDLYETSEEIMRQNLRRKHPEADEAEIERRLIAWLHDRPDERWEADQKQAKAVQEESP